MSASAATSTTATRADRPYLRAVEVADLLGVPRSTVYALAARGDLPALRVGRRLLLFERAALSARLAEARR